MEIVEMGYELDSLSGRPDGIRWWLFLELPGNRNQRARRGVTDHGFRFARGGRASTAAEAERALADARAQAAVEMRLWGHQPSHILGPNGRLIPVDEIQAWTERPALTTGEGGT